MASQTGSPWYLLPMPDEIKFKLQRRLGIVSLGGILLSAIIIFFYFRSQTTHTLEDISERSYAAVALAVVGSVNDHFNQYLHEVEGMPTDRLPREITQPDLRSAIHRLILDTTIVRAKIYDHSGRVVYSTKQEQIGNLQADNPGFIGAMAGKPTSKMIYRDTFNIFDLESEDANLTQSYVPIWDESRTAPIGVFEIYADVNDLVEQTEGDVITVFVLILTVMTVLFLALMFNIKKAETIIEQQRQESQEKQRTLEILSAKMVTAQEDEKKRIAFALHEDVVQSMTAVKMYLERFIQSLEKLAPGETPKVPDQVIPALQNAIQKIRGLSLDLRPRSLDDFGLKAAVKSLFTDCREVNPKISLGAHMQVAEEGINPEKKSIIYRIVKDTLNEFCSQNPFEGELLVSLDIEDGFLALKIQVEAVSRSGADATRLLLPTVDDFEQMRERTILSGGEFFFSNPQPQIAVALSVWP